MWSLCFRELYFHVLGVLHSYVDAYKLFFADALGFILEDTCLYCLNP